MQQIRNSFFFQNILDCFLKQLPNVLCDLLSSGCVHLFLLLLLYYYYYLYLVTYFKEENCTLSLLALSLVLDMLNDIASLHTAVIYFSGDTIHVKVTCLRSCVLA